MNLKINRGDRDLHGNNLETWLISQFFFPSSFTWYSSDRLTFVSRVLSWHSVYNFWQTFATFRTRSHTGTWRRMHSRISSDKSDIPTEAEDIVSSSHTAWDRQKTVSRFSVNLWKESPIWPRCYKYFSQSLVAVTNSWYFVIKVQHREEIFY